MAPRTQGFIAIPGAVAVIDSVVAGAVAGVAAIGLDLGTGITLTLGGVAFLVSLSVFFAWGRRELARGLASLDPLFSGPPSDDAA